MSNFPPVKTGHTSANNGAATVIIAADTLMSRRIKIKKVDCGYNATPNAGCLLTVSSGATVIYQLPITAGGPAPIDLDGFMTAPGAALTATLSASGLSNVIGYMNVSAVYD